MDALTPQPSPELPTAAPAVKPHAPSIPTGPVCGACNAPALVNWRRRLTDAELNHHLHTEKGRRDEILLLADPQLPAPAFPPLPTGDDMTRTIYACGPHAIHMEAAGLIHQATCTAPNEQHLPDCDCTPEPHPEAIEETPAQLPAHWQTGSAG